MRAPTRRLHPLSRGAYRKDPQASDGWCFILARRLFERPSFTSLDRLRTRVHDFIRAFNYSLGKPFRWTYTGRPLQA